MLTMLILLIKSTFRKVGADNTKMFEPRYLSYMANFVIEEFIQNLNDDDSQGLYNEEEIVNRKQTLEIEGIPLVMFWSREHYYDLIQKIEYSEKHGGQTKYVSERYAPRWVEEVLSYKKQGNITKETLDKQR